MEPNRSWDIACTNLDLIVQHNFTFTRKWKHEEAFEEDVYIHVPIDTLPRLVRYRPDVIITAELGARTLQAALYTLLVPKTRLVIWATVSELTERSRGRARTILRQWLMHRADAVVTNGRSGRRYIESFNFPSDRIFCTGYSPVESFFDPPPTRPIRPLRDFLFVGQLSERKGVGPLIRALDEVARARPSRDLCLKIVGEGPLLSRIQTHPSPGNLRIECLGHMTYGQLEAIYASSQALVFPSLADEWGLVVNEAMLKGLPVLGSVYSQAVQELVNEGENGWTFTPDDHESFVRVLNESLDTAPERLVELGRSARARAEDLTPDSVATVLAAAAQGIGE